MNTLKTQPPASLDSAMVRPDYKAEAIRWKYLAESREKTLEAWGARELVNVEEVREIITDAIKRIEAEARPHGSAFEMVDCTDDEQYFPLGHWRTLADAIAALDECKDPDDLGSDGCHDDYCKVEIREHKLGWSGYGKKVYQREWSQEYDEANDEYEWHVMPNNQDMP